MSKPFVLNIKTDRRNQLIDITPEIQRLVSDSKITNGVVFIFIPHTTAAITINENADPSVKSDIANFLEKLIPQNSNFDHSEGNSDSHIKASLVGSQVSVIIADGQLVLGTWQGICFCEFDGPRSRKVLVKIIPD